jgi:biopolymer transport protein ExbD
MSQINTTPLVDVMLVLLIIFLIAIPVVTTSIRLSLPQEAALLRQSRPENIIISVDPAGAVHWFDNRLGSAAELTERLRQVAAMTPQTEVQIRGDQAARFESVGRVLAACEQAGISHVAFITEPPGPAR